MAGETAPGRPGNLTTEQEDKLRQLWQLVLQVCAFGQEQNGASEAPSAADTAEKATQEEEAKKEKKSRLSIFSRKKKDAEPAAAASPGASGNPPIVLNLSKDGDGDKYGQTKQFYETLANMSPQLIRDTIWSMVKHDHPDALLLRFLRARKWDVERALIMMIATMDWRARDYKVDTDIMLNGEGAAVVAEKSATDSAEKTLGKDFMSQIRKGISYVHGHDKQGRPLCFVNVRKHRAGEETEEALERYTVWLIETCRYVLSPPVDTATIVFDMTGFSTANMDYTPVKFMIKCFEANYPESLGTVLVHKAPWIFQGIWKVIRGWLDPVVANKVHFTNNAKEMEEFIAIKHIPKDLDGEEDWTYEYVEPVEGENAKLADVETRDRLLAARGELYKAYEEATAEWIRLAGAGTVAGSDAKGAAAEEIKTKRTELAEKLRVDYWNVDPYLRARSYYDRTGLLLPGGKLNWYPETKAVEEKKEEAPVAADTTTAAPAEATVPPAAVTTSDDDVD
ncbi:putative phosphatidylinositol transporter protein [Chaetomium sp. MPI-SDFR-AT-0129]|nr:putative phosphatidylinositol transporter protein [Chaetomium sp. MPI-SDFR-AT-0129]